MLNIGPPELLLVLVIALVVVGPKKLPELARTLGRGLSEFRKVQDEVKDMVQLDLGMDPVPTPKTPPPTPHRTPRPASETSDASPDDTEPAQEPSLEASTSQAVTGDADRAADAGPTDPADPPASAE
jgi:TatA/E family protein of Tat protein translocase